MSLREAGIPFEIVPGVTAGLGVTAYAGIPVTHRGAASAVAFVTGHGDPESDPGHEPARLVGPGPVPGHAGRLHGRDSSRGDLPHLDATGKPGDTPAAVIEAGTSPRSAPRSAPWRPSPRSRCARACGPLLSWSSARSSACGTELDWFERLPLFGQRIVVTRPREEAVARGGRCSKPWVPRCCWRRRSKSGPITDPAPLDAAIDRLDDYDWLVFTSANGVRFFLGGSKSEAATCGPWAI